ncbi:hypothetical protein ACJW31_02G197500 [Castanea mollissima]
MTQLLLVVSLSQVYVVNSYYCPQSIWIKEQNELPRRR